MSNIEQTLSIIKPDAVERNLDNEIKRILGQVSESAINQSWSNYNDDKNLGRTLMGQNAWNNVLLATCFETPCSNAKNRTISCSRRKTNFYLQSYF